jgi:hypothetical protein
MAHSRCVQLDILSNQLFEAYRKMNETEISGIWNSSDNGVWVAVAHLHFAMREHKRNCIFCKRITQTIKMNLHPL